MSNAWKSLGPDERAEVEAGVVAAFIDTETGATRPTSEAKAEFAEFVRSGQRANRAWADIMIESFVDVGAGNFAANLWKRRDAFTTTVKGVQRTRSLNRGKKAVAEDGKRVDVQASLLDWSLQDLKDGLIAEVTRRREAQINIDTYAALIRLCEAAECEPVAEALARIGMTLDEYLASADQAAA